ncbi:MAG: DNA-formamidopyrimidine glycosylase family protein [Trebonia sp.]
MPEPPEVETLRRGLAAVLPGRRVLSVQVLGGKVTAGSSDITGPCVVGRGIG